MFTTLAISSLILAVPALAQHAVSGCPDTAIFIARGWNEQYPGRQGTLVTDICNDLSGSCDYEDITYDAFTTIYCNGVNDGVTNAVRQVNAYYARCPNSKIVISGYSEGATVMGDLLAGGGSKDNCGQTAGPISETSGASCNIAAALVFGNPSHTPYQSYNVLSGSAGQAANARTLEALQRLDYYAPRLHDYCQIDDLICAPGLGANTVEAHTNYFELYSEQAASWAASMVKAFPSGGYCAVPTTSSSMMSSSMMSSTASASSMSSSMATMSSVANSSMTVSKPASYMSATSTCTESTATPTDTCSESTMTQYTTVGSSSYAVSTTVLKPTDYVSYAPPMPTSTTTLPNSKTVVVSYITSTETTTYGPFTITLTSAIPATTSTLGSYTQWNNGTMTTCSSSAAGTGAGMASGTGYGMASGTGAMATPSGVMPYTGAANRATVAGGLMGMVGMVYLLL